jgi:2-amino-4-hydroxy-6-hydroxymethyldihydropteridine diphosphokinase
VYLGLGSNIAPEENLPRAFEMLSTQVHVEAHSGAWETPAVGSSGPNFINAAVQVSTNLAAGILKKQVLRKIENQLGRLRTADKNAPRSIDLDILIYGNRICDLHIWGYAHLAAPLAELIPDFQNTETKETLAEAARRLLDVSRGCLRPLPNFHWDLSG